MCRTLSKLPQQEKTRQKNTRTLTLREQDLVQKVAQGLCNKEIARLLSISEATVKTHQHRIYNKLQVRDRTELLNCIQRKNPMLGDRIARQKPANEREKTPGFSPSANIAVSDVSEVAGSYGTTTARMPLNEQPVRFLAAATTFSMSCSH